MQLTIFGAAVIAIGLLLLFCASRLAMSLFVLGCTLLGGSAAIALPALGGSTIPPAHLAVVFLVARCLAPDRSSLGVVGQSIAVNRVLVWFALYGVVGTMLLPRLFAGALMVTPLRPNPTRDLFAVEPLRFTNQNVTVAVYYLATLFTALGATVLATDRRAAHLVPRAAALIGATHALLGFASVFLRGPLGSFFAFFRNGFYAQLEQSVGDIARMNGIFAEPAIYAVYGFGWLIFLFEMWLRGVATRWTGPATALLGLALALSTSSTAYIGFAVYGLVLALRIVTVPGTVRAGQATTLAIVLLGSVVVALGLAATVPEFAARIVAVVNRVTVDKLGTESAVQRAFWAKQGLTAFVVSHGLGIGPGSFRSSSLVTAILGSMGVFGSIAFLWHLGRTFMPLRRSTWVQTGEPAMAIGAAASWTAVVMLVPPAFSAASPDPGMLWGAFSGLALGLRGLGLSSIPAGPAKAPAPSFRPAHTAPATGIALT